MPRPCNAFMYYRKDFWREYKASGGGLNQIEVSRIAGEKWKAVSAEKKAYYEDLAREGAAEHKRKYPEYKYNESSGKASRKSTTSRAAPRLPRPSPPSPPIAQASSSKSPVNHVASVARPVEVEVEVEVGVEAEVSESHPVYVQQMPTIVPNDPYFQTPVRAPFPERSGATSWNDEDYANLARFAIKPHRMAVADTVFLSSVDGSRACF